MRTGPSCLHDRRASDEARHASSGGPRRPPLSSSGDGGAFYNAGSMNVSNCTLAGNSASDGVAIYNGARMSVTNNMVARREFPCVAFLVFTIREPSPMTRRIASFASAFCACLILSWVPTARAGYTLLTLASFDGTNGAYSYVTGAALDSNGNLYGTTTLGGSTNGGTVWEVVRGSNAITVLHNFNGVTDGMNPQANVTVDSSGDIFGTASGGGINGTGTVWEISHSTGAFSVVASFGPGGVAGQGPTSAVTFDTNGNLWGTTLEHGSNGVGTLWEIVKGSNTITTVASFSNSLGYLPTGLVTFGPDGNLYGTTQEGGASGAGTVWSYNPSTGTLAVVASFNSSNGSGPFGGIVFDSSGNMYGTTVHGGANDDGTVWKIAAGSSTIQTIASFSGSNPNRTGSDSPVTIDPRGDLFGTTTDNTVWEIAAGTSTLQTIATFNVADGDVPQGLLSMDSNGNLFGSTQEGGPFNDGVVFELVNNSAAVPEPSSLVMGLISLMVGGGIVVVRRLRS